MTTKKEEAITDSVKSLEEMANLVLTQLTLLEKLMSLNDKIEMDKILSTIEENENKIDQYEVIISDKFINSIILYQPVASDIRKLNSVLRISINLERIGDIVLNIINSLKSIKGTAEFEAMQEVLMNMLVSGVTMVEKSLLSFMNNDDSYAEWTIKNDEIVDEMNRKLLINSVSRAKVNEKTREMLLSYMDLKNIITNMERIADHATNIAEVSIYSMQGTDIRHQGYGTHNSDKGNI
jgi:phosphate transport system protein